MHFLSIFFVLDETKFESLEFFLLNLDLMAAPPAKARADYDYIIKLHLIGDGFMLPLAFSRDPIDEIDDF